MALQKLGKYEILNEIGRGAMGLVYKALDPILEREVAIKTMMASMAGMDAESKARFYREAKSAAKLTHRNIVTIYDMGEEQGIPYIAMEFLDGVDLHRKVKRQGVLPVREALEITGQVLRGLHYAHEFHIVHRDVKPANVYILRNGTAKILDFGIAKLASSEMTRTGMVLGTVDYMSPEQIRAEKSVDGRSDLFSAGVILYELISGKKPFPGEAITQVMYRIVHEEPVALPPERDLPPALVDVVRRALQKDPDKRFQSGEEFAEALDEIRRQMQAELSTMQLESPEMDLDAKVTTARRLFDSGSFDQSSAILKEVLQEEPGHEKASELLTLIERRRTSDSTLVLEPEAVSKTTGGKTSIEEILEEIEEERKTSPPTPGRDETGAQDLTVRLEDSGIRESPPEVSRPPAKPTKSGEYRPTEALSPQEMVSISGPMSPMRGTAPGAPSVARPAAARETRPGTARTEARPAVAAPPAKGVSPALIGAGVLAVAIVAVSAYFFLSGGEPEMGESPGEIPGAPGPPGEGGAAIPAATGYLAIDAQPWAEVIRVKDVSSGADVELPPEGGAGGPTTPVVLDLPAGTYEVTLRHPQFGDVQVGSVDVAPDEWTQINETMPDFSFQEKVPAMPP